MSRTPDQVPQQPAHYLLSAVQTCSVWLTVVSGSDMHTHAAPPSQSRLPHGGARKAHHISPQMLAVSCNSVHMIVCGNSS